MWTFVFCLGNLFFPWEPLKKTRCYILLPEYCPGKIPDLDRINVFWTLNVVLKCQQAFSQLSHYNVSRHQILFAIMFQIWFVKGCTRCLKKKTGKSVALFSRSTEEGQYFSHHLSGAAIGFARFTCREHVVLLSTWYCSSTTCKLKWVT